MHDEIACDAASNFCFQELFLKQTLTRAFSSYLGVGVATVVC